MKTEIAKNYLDIESVANEILDIYKEKVNDYKDEPYFQIMVDCYYLDEESLEQRAYEMAFELSDDMKTYLHQKSHRISGNFNNVEYDYIEEHKIISDGVASYNCNCFFEFVERLDNGTATQEDFEWITSWFWETFGTWGIGYNFADELANYAYEYENELQTA